LTFELPGSIITFIPSMVMAVYAILVAKMSLYSLDGRKMAFCWCGDILE
jgi:hypothetical protein